jgi:hypothetical protein
MSGIFTFMILFSDTMTEVKSAVELMTDVRSKTSDVIQHIDNILKKAKKGLYDTSKVY